MSRAKAVFIPPAELVVVARSSYPTQKGSPVHAQRSLLKKRVLHLLGVFRPARHPEQHKADDEQHRDAAHAHVGTAGELAAHTDDHGAQEGCPLAADVEQAEVFAGLFVAIVMEILGLL